MDGAFQLDYMSGNGVGFTQCRDYPTFMDGVMESEEVFVLDLVSSDIAQLQAENSADSAVIRIMDTTGK